MVKKKYPNLVVTGKDLFDASLFQKDETRQVFFHFMGHLKRMVSAAKPTLCHWFIKRLNDTGKLMRCYTQNIDCLEEGVLKDTDKTDASSSKMVMLHGSLRNVVCTLCNHKIEFTSKHIDVYLEGEAPSCPECEERNRSRERRQKRLFPVGFLRPDIVLYGENHSSGEDISNALTKDLDKKPDMMIVMGTSLKVCGIKQLVRDVKTVLKSSDQDSTKKTPKKSSQFKTILINKADLSVTKEWQDTFDVFWNGEADHIVDFVGKGLDERENVTEQKRKERERLKLMKITNTPETQEKGQKKLNEMVRVKKNVVIVPTKDKGSKENTPVPSVNIKTRSMKKSTLAEDKKHTEKTISIIPTRTVNLSSKNKRSQIQPLSPALTPAGLKTSPKKARA